MKNWIHEHSEIKGILWILFVLIQLISLITFSATSSSENWLGLVGHFVGCFWYFFFGITSFFILAAFSYLALQLFVKKTKTRSHFIALGIAVFALCILFT